MTMTLNLSSAGSFTRAALHIARASSVADAALAAEADRASPQAVAFLRTKAASVSGSLNASTWGDAMANQDGAAPAFVESLRSQSLFYAMAELANVFPLNSRVLATAALQIDTGTSEVGFLPVIQGGFAPQTLEPRQAGGIVVLSGELVNATDPASFAVLQRELQRAAVAAVDSDALANVILDGIVPLSFDLGAAMASLAAMLDAVATTGAERLLFAAGPAMANGLTICEAIGGGRMFPEMSPTGGMLLNTPCIVSDRLPPGRLILVDASSFAVNVGFVDVDRSQGAALNMRTDPTGPAETVSMFQTNSVALRVICTFGCERMRAGAVAVADLSGS